MHWLVLSLILVAVLIAVFSIIWGRWKRLSILKRYGIPSMIPNFFYGNLPDYQALPNVLFDEILVKRFGKICGYYFGAKPVILVADPKVLEAIQKYPPIRKSFLDRPRRIPGGINPDKKRRIMLGNLPVTEWKKMRKIIGPFFGSHNLGEMIGNIQLQVDTFMNIVRERETDEIDFYSLFQYLTLDIIAKTAFGVDSSMQSNPNDELLMAVNAEFSKGINGGLVKMYLCWPELSPLLSRVRELSLWLKTELGLVPPSALWEAGRDAVLRRLSLSIRDQSYHDLLYHLLNGNELSRDAVVANTVLIFEAAYETTSSCLGFIIHILAHRPRYQKKIRREIRKALREPLGGLNSFSTLQTLKFMEACVYEALRLYPTQTTFISRSGDTDMEVTGEDGKVYTFPKGVHLQVALFQLHHDPSLWKQPNKFRPHRFLDPAKKDLRPAQYQAFGLGPRECIGKAFALMTMKIILANLLLKYKIVPSETTEKMGKISIQFKTATMTPKRGSHARVEVIA